MINQELVTDFGLERVYPSTYTTYLGTTLYITTFGLQFWVKENHFKERKVMMFCLSSEYFYACNDCSWLSPAPHLFLRFATCLPPVMWWAGMCSSLCPLLLSNLWCPSLFSFQIHWTSSVPGDQVLLFSPQVFILPSHVEGVDSCCVSHQVN